ncbi:hypothetical protein L7F22_037397 [Adiantum nelumboides]|nr:hypothetical protein [Adiantum nelumboides]
MGRSKRIEWQYVEKIKALRKGQWTCKCNFCGHVWGGGPHRIRSHLLSLPGQGVGPCDSVTEDVKDIVRRLHADASSDGKDNREAIDALVDDLGGSASQSQGDASLSTHGEGSTHASGSSKSNVNSSKKRKVAQGARGLPAAFGLQARKQADQALRRFFYAEDVPEWKVRSPYFLDMIKAIGNVGPSYVPPSYHALRTTHLNNELQWLPNGSEYQVPSLDKSSKTYTSFSCSQDTLLALKNDPIVSRYPDITLAKLRPGQCIELEAHAVKGLGKTHAKWSPVATARYRMLPEVVLLEDVRDTFAEELVDKCPVNVFDIEDVSKGRKKAVVARPRDCTLCRECVMGEGWDKRVQLRRVKEHFIFSVESTGALSPEVLFVEAVKILEDKCQRILAELS